MPIGHANIINFIRYDHGLETIAGEMAEILKRNLPGTWLLQYDALVDGPYVDFLKKNITPEHEVGLWFEINHRHCNDAAVKFRGEKPELDDFHD